VEDIEGVLARTLEQFGFRKYSEYKELIHEAIVRLAEDPEGPPARRRTEIHADARTLHIAQRARRARHLLLYRIGKYGVVEIARLLHDSMEPRRHLPSEFGERDKG
jgi:toxin ParE1/3/4